MELPIDHFRLLGISPSADSAEVLRACQLRLDRPPSEGFTNEVLAQRSELLRSSSDLLIDKSLRREYETALLGGKLGLELSAKREVAGLILLWESDSSYEAFHLARKALQPPQAPALGSGREADLTLVAALSCRDAALQEQESRHYDSAAVLLQEGIHLLQRMGKLQDNRQHLEKDLEALLPYRILDLLSRDISDQEAHQQGLRLLNAFVLDRGGLEGKNLPNSKSDLDQDGFELFYKQIRKFLTLQEQIDFYIEWKRRGSEEAGYLAAISLVAAGFSRRKPQRLRDAKKYLLKLKLEDSLDLMPLLGSIDLLLADVDQAEEKFRNCVDQDLKLWLENYPGNSLGAMCDYCRDWLRRDVLPGYRDVDAEAVDLEAWFADRDVQEYVEKAERKGALGMAKSGFSFLTSISSDANSASPQSEGYYLEEGDEFVDQNDFNSISELEDSTSRMPLKESTENDRSISQSLIEKLNIPSNLFRGSITKIIAILFLLFASAATYSLLQSRFRSQSNVEPESTEFAGSIDYGEKDDEIKPLPLEDRINLPLIEDEPTDQQVISLIEAWLRSKSDWLEGNKNNDLILVARESLVELVKKERSKDIDLDQIQITDASITSFEVVDRTSKRIEVEVLLSYRDKKVKSSGEIVEETSRPRYLVTYILGREKKIWKLVAYKTNR